MKNSKIKIILLQTSHPGNVGAAARAMKTMDLTDLVLVDCVVFPHAEAVTRASGADDVLAQAQQVATLAEALQGCSLVFGMAAYERQLPWPLLTPRQAAAKAIGVSEQAPVAFVFGTERIGLSNQQLQHCHYQVKIPTSGDFSSLNLAAAVQVMAYELYLAMTTLAPTVSDYDQLATHDQMEGLYQQLEQTLITLGFLDPAQPRQIMARLRRLLTRAHTEQTEVNILRGMLTAIQKRVLQV